VTADNPNPPIRDREGAARRSQCDRRVSSTAPRQLSLAEAECRTVAAAVEAIHRMSGAAAQEQAVGEADEAGNACSGCGGSLRGRSLLCVVRNPNQRVVGDAAVQPQSGAAQHHIHHHYHHLVQSCTGIGAPLPSRVRCSSGRAPGSRHFPGSRAEASAASCPGLAQPATPGTSTSARLYAPTLLSSVPAFRRFAVCLHPGISYLAARSRIGTWRWNRCASKCW